MVPSTIAIVIRVASAKSSSMSMARSTSDGSRDQFIAVRSSTRLVEEDDLDMAKSSKAPYRVMAATKSEAASNRDHHQSTFSVDKRG